MSAEKMMKYQEILHHLKSNYVIAAKRGHHQGLTWSYYYK